MDQVIHIKIITPIMDGLNDNRFYYYFICVLHVIILIIGGCIIWYIDTIITSGIDFIEIWQNNKIRFIFNRFFIGVIPCLFILLLLFFCSFFFSFQINWKKWLKIVLVEFIFVLLWHTIVSLYTIHAFNNYYKILLKWGV